MRLRKLIYWALIAACIFVAMMILVSCEKSLNSLYLDLVPTTVTIRGQNRCGSGVFVTKDVVLTANHIVESETKFGIVLWDSLKTTAEVLATDVNNDLALLRLDPNDVKHFKPIRTLNFETNPKIGDPVFIIGSPYLYSCTLSAGVVSRLSTKIMSSPWICSVFLVNYINAPGYSGSPVFDIRGDVIGIHVGHVGNFGVVIPSYSVCYFLRANGLM